MNRQPLGDSAWLLSGFGFEQAANWAQSLREADFEGILNVVSAFDEVAVHVDPTVFDPLKLDSFKVTAATRQHRKHVIPVCYELGEDFHAAAQNLKIEPDEFALLHSGTEYRCYAVGFTPGFAYLGHLDERITGLPRLPRPRVRVKPGSVGITGRQTAVYPSESPGGWWLIGLTPLKMIDLSTKHFPIQSGDLVQFIPITRTEFDERQGEVLR